MKEILIQRSIVENLNYLGCICWRTAAGMVKKSYTYRRGRRVGTTKDNMIRIGPAGMSDVIGIHKKTGRFIAIEVKRPETRKNVSILQQQFLENMKQAGAITGVATTVDEAIKIVNDGAKAGI